MMKVFESIGIVHEARHLAELLPFLRAHTFLTADQLWKCVMNLMSLKDFEDALRAGLKGGRFASRLAECSRGSLLRRLCRRT